MGQFATTALKGVGVLVLAILALSAIATIVGLALSIVATVVSIVVSLAVIGLVVLAAVNLWSLLGDNADEPATEPTVRNRADDRDPRERLRDRYVAGEIDDDEFERQLDLLLESESAESSLDRLERERAADRDTDRTRLWDR